MVKRKRSNDNGTLAKSDGMHYLDRYLKTIGKEIKKYSKIINGQQYGGGNYDLTLFQFDELDKEIYQKSEILEEKFVYSGLTCNVCDELLNSYGFCETIHNNSWGRSEFHN